MFGDDKHLLFLGIFRLLFMADGSPCCKQLARLLDIASIEKYQHYFVLPPGVPALKIILRGAHGFANEL